MIEVEGLTKRFGDRVAVEGLSFQVRDGEIFGFLGPNGAGKTTTVRMLTGLIGKSAGTARVGGHAIGDPAEALEIRRMIGLVPDNVGLYEELSAYRNLDFYGRMYDCPEPRRGEAIERLLRLLGLWEQRDLPVGTFSKGMKQKVAVARALVHDPQVLFLDEPTANLDPEASRTVRDFILDQKTAGKTIFLNTHNLAEAQRICDRIGILRTRLLAVGTPTELEGRLGGRKTVIQLQEVTDGILAAVRSACKGPVSSERNRITIDTEAPEQENPAILEAIQRAGGKIQFVTDVRPSIEDVYLRFVREGS